MEHQDEANEQHQGAMKDVRSHLDAEKSRGVHPPRTVDEEVREMTSEGGDGHRLRDPLKAAQAQRQQREDAGEAASLSTSQRANEHDVEPESLDDPARQRSGTDVKAGHSHDQGQGD